MRSWRHRFGVEAWSRFGAAFVLACGGLACGEDETRSGRVASMVATPSDSSSTEVDAKGDAGPPAVESVVLEPKRPVAGVRLRAKARLKNSGGRKLAVAYQWRTASGRVLGAGQELDTTGLEAGSRIEVVATPELEDETGAPFVHSFRLADQASQIAVVVIDTREGKRVGSLLRALVETSEEEAGFDDVVLEWRVDGKPVGTDEELDTTPFQPGSVVELRARPAGDLAEQSRSSRSILAEPIVLEPSAPPEITSHPSAGLEGGQFRYAVQASSAVPGATLRYELVKGPEGMTVDAASGLVAWRPTSTQRGRFEVEVAVFDQWGSGVAQRFAIGADSNSAPAAAAP